MILIYYIVNTLTDFVITCFTIFCFYYYTTIYLINLFLYLIVDQKLNVGIIHHFPKKFIIIIKMSSNVFIFVNLPYDFLKLKMN